MNKQDELKIDQHELVQAWQQTLPSVLSNTDRATVQADEADDRTLRITIHTAGHQMFSFDFKVEYVDSREVHAELVDVEQDGITVDERTDSIQELIHDYMRDIHECAQALHTLTHV